MSAAVIPTTDGQGIPPPYILSRLPIGQPFPILLCSVFAPSAKTEHSIEVYLKNGIP
jgi:hypothetical protein